MAVFYNMTESEVELYTNFHLSIEVSDARISLLLLNKENSRPEAIEHLKREKLSFEEALEKSEILAKASPNTVSCALANSYFTLIPKALYATENKELYLSQVITLSASLTVREDYFMDEETVCCFAFLQNEYAHLVSKFPTIQFKHISSVVCDTQSEGISVNFSSANSYEISLKKDKKLLYFNRFEFENNEESLYYLSLFAEKQKLSLTTETLHVSGEVFADGDILSFWKQFIPQENITFSTIEASQLNAVSRHQFFTLHKQHSCVL